VDNPTTRSDLSPPPFSTDLFPTFTQLIYIVIHRPEEVNKCNCYIISFIYDAEGVTTQKNKYTSVHLEDSCVGKCTQSGCTNTLLFIICCSGTRGIRFAQMPRYRAETTSTSFLPSG
jgi:hypothetical protein